MLTGFVKTTDIYFDEAEQDRLIPKGAFPKSGLPNGIYWTGTKNSCSSQVAAFVTESGTVFKPWDKTFRASALYRS